MAKKKTVRIDCGSYGRIRSVSAKHGARIIRNLTTLQVTAGDIQAGDMILMVEDGIQNYEALVAQGGIATLVPVLSVGNGER